MDTSVTLSPSSVNANKTMETNYKLALKLFMNKNHDKSFSLIHQLYQDSFIQYQANSISENLFIKIINLYLIEIGVALKEKQLVDCSDLTSNSLINKLGKIYERIPSEILYNYHLVFVSNRDTLIPDKHPYLTQLKSQYMNLHQRGKYNDKFLKLVVFEILPIFDEFAAAQNIISHSTTFTEIDWKRLQDIQMNKSEIKHQEKLKKEEEVRKQQEELKKQRQLQSESNIKYKSIKEIQKQYASESVTSPVATTTSDSNRSLSELREKLVYVTNLLKGYIKDNSLIIIVVLILLFISKRFINIKKVNLKEKIIDTIKMAFKFSYL
ncbi:hypothetical protein JA1_003336 [Spathaspora sp. JA1]|nr:hypothetical protein JA1_003336 [Spathaspora sp. JA1]